VYKFGDCRILRGPHLPINALVPLGDDVACTFLCERRKARGTEQRRKFTVTASQSGFSSCYARRREHFNRSRESLRGPPILIRIPIFNSSEVAKISAGRKCFTRRSTDIQDIDRSRRLLPALSPSLSLSLSLAPERETVSKRFLNRLNLRGAILAGTCERNLRESARNPFLAFFRPHVVSLRRRIRRDAGGNPLVLNN